MPISSGPQIVVPPSADDDDGIEIACSYQMARLMEDGPTAEMEPTDALV